MSPDISQMTGLEIIKWAQDQRAAAGLRLEWIIPAVLNSPARNYTAFAKDESQKAAWLANGSAKGWQFVS